MSELKPCWKCGSPGMIDENGGEVFAVCTNTRCCSNSGVWGIDIATWNRGGISEVVQLRRQLERAEERMKSLEKVATSVRRDLILRAEPDWDGSGQQVVNLSAGIWDELNRVLDIKSKRRENK